MHNLGENIKFGNNPASQSQATLQGTLTSGTHFVYPQTMKTCYKTSLEKSLFFIFLWPAFNPLEIAIVEESWLSPCLWIH